MSEQNLPTPSGRETYNSERGYPPYSNPHSPDVEMTGSEFPSPVNTHPERSQRPSISPALLAEDSRHRHNSYSSVSTDQRHYSYSASATTSPAFGPQAYAGYAPSTHSASGSTLTSPALLPQRDLDQEATAALLMLNQTDRRGTERKLRGTWHERAGSSDDIRNVRVILKQRHWSSYLSTVPVLRNGFLQLI